jgi:hypothetical protein
MPITINGSGTVTGISAGGLPDGVITTDDLASTVPVAKAWVNFNGDATPAIRASYNVSSITDNGTGDYTVNFTNAFADTNYAVVSSPWEWVGINAGTGFFVKSTTISTSSVRGTFLNTAGSTVDTLLGYVAIFR